VRRWYEEVTIYAHKEFLQAMKDAHEEWDTQNQMTALERHIASDTLLDSRLPAALAKILDCFDRHSVHDALAKQNPEANE
jgi:hypothetical protein